MAKQYSSAVEAWTFLVLEVAVIVSRIILRWKTQTFRGLAVDDFLMAAAVPISIVSSIPSYIVETVARGLANSGMTPQERAAIDPSSEEFDLRVKGSKAHMAGWITYSALLWTLKACWLFFYKRLGDRIDNIIYKVNLGLALCGITYVVVFMTILFGCFPIAKHWQINPDPGNSCYPAVSRLQVWTMLVTDVVTDLYIILIPLPVSPCLPPPQ
ncbi:hypothetical protein CDD83_3182 [Cordyceps sp. RAO-2017]|nr:hypothetical protein CDD83_3182 [Cordyceps sp. RAO-2017]